MKRAAVIVSALLMLVCTPGCETGLVHNKSYLRAAVISCGDEVSLTLAFFQEDSGTVTAHGKDIASAIDAAELCTGRKIFTGFTELVIVSGSSPAGTLEYVFEEWKVSPSCLVAAGSNASGLLTADSAERLHGSVEEASGQGIVPDCDIVTVLGSLLNKGSAEVAELGENGVTGSIIING
ncbi:MAG: hypothetical protein IKO47_08285 [Ruminococcus sp.]|nr:hypothetical protein [Ruminococcus sp.]